MTCTMKLRSKAAPVVRSARVGSLVLIDIPNGLGRNGQEYKSVRARVAMVQPTHLVCVLVGSSGARPYCAESYKLVRW